MFDQMKKMMDLKKQADKIKKELEATIIECKDVRGINVKMNGAQFVQEIEIDDSWLDPEKKKRFHTELIRAINMSVKKSQTLAAQKMRSAAGLNIPGM